MTGPQLSRIDDESARPVAPGGMRGVIASFLFLTLLAGCGGECPTEYHFLRKINFPPLASVYDDAAADAPPALTVTLDLLLVPDTDGVITYRYSTTFEPTLSGGECYIRLVDEDERRLAELTVPVADTRDGHGELTGMAEGDFCEISDIEFRCEDSVLLEAAF